MREVEIDAVPLDRLAALLEPERIERLSEYAARARDLLEGRTVWSVNATATGGGVAEMLQALLAYSRGAGVDARWLVLDGTPTFFGLTKRIHNVLHGSPGDGGPLGEEERATYEGVLAKNLKQLLRFVRPDDVVLLHDPQTAGLVPGVQAAGAHVVWRSHIGRDTPTDLTDVGWAFLRPYVEQAEAVIFSRGAYVPAWVDQNKVWVIPPSLDPFTAKNGDIPPGDVEAVLRHAGLTVTTERHGRFLFTRRDGSTGLVRPHAGLIEGGHPVPGHARVVLQVSRWDRLKDMAGVLAGFADHLPHLPDDVQLMLVGPETAGVTDDPEGAEVFEECKELRLQLPEESRRRIHLCSLPMDDGDENAYLVNALQRYATVVVQKSLIEGFGLTVTEPMWKGKPVIASRVGGIQDQIIDGESGLLLDDPTDLDSFGAALDRLLGDVALAAKLGENARERVRNHYLGDRHLMQYVDLFEQLYR
ncbi:glycosyltransferase [Nocardioides pocheonensis]|uniref:Glycosyltransferase n=1 Tax=Nocardioides pocheonensis TaxID=661485 RepID=A0A3N0GLM5_9ACTN|nr:glycosyltransferase [Nocardioides pocheonensis]RNM13072.1 glycosyltransferase [Nocardioides pocheonensis]